MNHLLRGTAFALIADLMALPSYAAEHWIECSYDLTSTNIQSGEILINYHADQIFSCDDTAGKIWYYKNHGLYTNNQDFSSISITPTTISWTDLRPGAFTNGSIHYQIDRQAGDISGTGHGIPGTVGGLYTLTVAGKCHAIAPQYIAPGKF